MMGNELTTQLTTQLASRLGMAGGVELVNVLKQTAFKGQVSDAQMVALLVVANQYGLNPWTKEIYAFPDQRNGIVPVVGVDGWSRIINENSQFDGMEFKQDEESCTCIIYRKDRSHPVSVTEYMSECKRDGIGPWKSHPKRMLRHKALIQAARLAFGFVGIFDQDEAERIAEVEINPMPESGKSVARSDWESLDEETQNWMANEALAVHMMIEKSDIEGAHNHIASLNMDDTYRTAFDTRLDSKQRAMLRAYSYIIHSQTLGSLATVWEAVPKYAKPILEAIKDKRKAELSQPEQAAA